MWYSTDKLREMNDAFKARTHNLPEDLKKATFDEDLEAGWKRIQDCVLAFKAGPNILSGGRFDTLSLGTWMEIVKAVDLDYVPAEIVKLVDFIEVARSQFAPVPLDIPEELLRYRGMVRLDSCGSAVLKAKMGLMGDHGSSEHIHCAREINGRFHFEFDERTANSLMTYVGQIGPDGNSEQPIWWRPWVTALQVEVTRPKFMGRGDPERWPLEWRVFVQNGRVAAISSYYIQAPVMMTDERKAHVMGIIGQTNRLLAFMRERNIQPWHPRYIDDLPEDEVSFSIDFISLPSGPAFLEAGPAVPVDEGNVPVLKWGAHPCNFMSKIVSGLALSTSDVRPL